MAVKQNAFCYADPPYPGLARKFYSHDPRCAEVDHAALMVELDEKYDRWALSTVSTSLRDVIAVAPKDIRIAAWVKPFASFKPGVNPAYTWEPVIYRTPNRNDRGRTVRDHAIVGDAVAENITLQRGLVGAKPEGFCFWLFRLIGARCNDEFVDMFPGSGAVTRAWEKWKNIEAGVHETGTLFEVK